MAPEVYGLTSAVRAPVRKLRRRRNDALHGVAPFSGSPVLTKDNISLGNFHVDEVTPSPRVVPKSRPPIADRHHDQVDVNKITAFSCGKHAKPGQILEVPTLAETMPGGEPTHEKNGNIEVTEPMMVTDDAKCCPSIVPGWYPLRTIEECAQRLVQLSLALSPPYESGEDDDSDGTRHAW